MISQEEQVNDRIDYDILWQYEATDEDVDGFGAVWWTRKRPSEDKMDEKWE